VIGTWAARYVESSDWLTDDDVDDDINHEEHLAQTGWTKQFVASGRKLFVVFPAEDRENLLLRAGECSPSVGGRNGSTYIDPLRPPTDGEHSCFRAQCFYCDLRASQGFTLVLPAGWMHYVLTIEPTALVCIEMAAASALDTSLEVLQLVRRLNNSKQEEAATFFSAWQHKGFDLMSMVRLFCRFCANSHEEEVPERRKQARSVVGHLPCLAQGADPLVLRPAIAWLQQFADGQDNPDLPVSLLSQSSIRQPEWSEPPNAEDLFLYSRSGVGVSSDDDRGALYIKLNGGQHDLRKEVSKFMTASNSSGGGGSSSGSSSSSSSARVAFVEGVANRQLNSALPVELCGGENNIVHGQTSLLFSEGGALTTMHFDTGPYSCISFHLIAGGGPHLLRPPPRQRLLARSGLPKPNNVAMIGSRLLVTLSKNHRLLLYRRDSDSKPFDRGIAMLAGAFDQLAEPNLKAADPSELVELESNVEILSSDLVSLRQDGFEYIAQSVLESTGVSAPHRPIQHRLIIRHINEAIGFGLFYVGDTTLARGTELAIYTGELLTQGLLEKRETQLIRKRRRFIFQLGDFEDTDKLQSKCPICKKTTTDDPQPVLLCDVCDRSFHSLCQGICDHSFWQKWVCSECCCALVKQHLGEPASLDHSIKAIDAEHKGNATRFINHSCEPNTEARLDPATRELQIVTSKAVRSGEQITLHYNPDLTERPDSAFDCLCGTRACRGFVAV